MGPVKYITEAEARNLVREVIDEYESTIGAVRHKENTHNFFLLFAALNKTRGAILAVGGLMAVIKLIELLKH